MARIEIVNDNGARRTLGISDREANFLWRIVCDIIAINEPGALEPEV